MLNAERVEKRKAAIFLDAISAATKGLDKTWFDAFAKSSEEAEAMYNIHKAKAQRDQAMSGGM